MLSKVLELDAEVKGAIEGLEHESDSDTPVFAIVRAR